MNATIADLPAHLRQYCVAQSTENYTTEDHAAWRFIMKQAIDFFSEHSLPFYQEGLRRTGITVERIPSIEDMDTALRGFGWGAVPVCGFIPPGAFLEFQARRILPIAADMRTVRHIAYTPAPDIVHEAAGHAPILIDSEYSEYLTRYAAMAQKAIFSQEDLDLYEAIRLLSDLKENPDSTPEQILQAELGLAKASANVPYVSEAQKVARMNWWTVEYGLIGDLASPKIYGAGLLSSVGESKNCLTDAVRKIPLSVNCIETSYDITRPQPQLFVAKDIPHLVSVLEDLEAKLAYKVGGDYAIDEGLRCRTIVTVELSSGLGVSGRLGSVERAREAGSLDFLKFEGPVQLSYEGSELKGQGVAQHPHGFSSPLGRFAEFSDREPHTLKTEELQSKGIRVGSRKRLEFVNGFVVEGLIKRLTFEKDKLLVVTFEDCTVARGSEVYFKPDWGDFDMAVGSARIPSVHGGAADRMAYGSHDLGSATSKPGRSSPFTEREKQIFARYKTLRELRGQIRDAGSTLSQESVDTAKRVAEEVASKFADQWLLRFEALEVCRVIAGKGLISRDIVTTYERTLQDDTRDYDPDIKRMIKDGLALL